MKIHEVIRKYRKQAGLTQEQVANYLGVTAPAVNKWENGSSCPDISLLAPLARVLKIDVDTLLSFHEELDQMEISHLVTEVQDLIREQGVQIAFARCEALIREYPCCDLLILCLAQVLDMQMVQEGMNGDAEEGRRKILSWYELVSAGADVRLATMAKIQLVTHYQRCEDCEKAQRLLDEIPDPGYDKRPVQAALYVKQGKEDEAGKIYEQIVFENASNSNSALLLLMEQKQRLGQQEQAEELAQLIRKLAELLELGVYAENVPECSLAMAAKDTSRALDALERIVSGLDVLIENSDPELKLYPHLKGHDPEKSRRVVRSVREMLLRGLKEDQEVEFLRGDVRFRRLLERLEKKTADETDR